jgi:hypothetical protein
MQNCGIRFRRMTDFTGFCKTHNILLNNSLYLL